MPDAALAALLALASHELRGPTGVVRGYLKMLDQEALAERPRKAVRRATEGADRLVALLDEVSELSEFKRGAIRLSLRSVSLRSVLAQAVQAVAIPESDVTLDVIAPMDVRVRLDEARMRFVFERLIVALARAQNGAVTLELTLVTPRTPKSAPRVMVGIRSLGRGTANERPLDVSRGGMGLSLALADAVITAHGGRLRERWLSGRWVGFAVRL